MSGYANRPQKARGRWILPSRPNGVAVAKISPSFFIRMTSLKGFQSQLTSIMEALTRAAVAEICGLVDDGYAVLQLEISRSHKENEALRRKLELIESIIARGSRRRDGGTLDCSGPRDEEGVAGVEDATAGEF
ncbi:hypothetical protein GOODEAATRI_028294 [Goodea atripinnis]|uniref:Uncharacterized protein n=1 Tax=Goodea atripinnis TaxID=208336 RepID=A0ABV0P8E1_9TELE